MSSSLAGPNCHNALHCVVHTKQFAQAGSAASEDASPKDVQVELQYLKDDPLYDTVKPLQVVPDWADTEHRTNIVLEQGAAETIHDIRGRENELLLDTNGFCYVNAPTQFNQWSSQQKIGSDYLPELETLLRREVDGCDEIIFYDARLRQATDEGVKIQGLSYKPFARQVHRDNTDSSVLTKIRNLTEMKADYLLSGRARIINIWRPIKHPVYDCGLAVADGGKMRDGDVVEADRVRSDNGQFWDTMGVVKYRPGYEWHYMSEQSEADVLLFKNYDSADVPAKHCIHTAFDIPPDQIPLNAPTRESIEVRALVFTYPADGCRPISITPHPLAESLRQGHLKRLDDEPSVIDRLRTDIDEAKEVKDAVLLLRRKEIVNLEKVCDTLTTRSERLTRDLHQADDDRMYLRVELEKTQTQRQLEKARAEAMKSQICVLRQQLRQAQASHQPKSQDAQASKPPPNGPAKPNDERAMLYQTIDGQRREIENWKAEAMGRGQEAVSRCWRASVDEAVRQEREKDGWVIQNLVDEIKRLKYDRQATGGDHDSI